jgi:3-methyladenine DNA glycosylase AlkC
MEVIAVDQNLLFRTLFPNIRDQPNELSARQLLIRMAAGGRTLYREYGHALWGQAVAWRSDIARGWAAMAVGQIPDLGLGDRLRLARVFAKDEHFAVREWAWLGVRDAVIQVPLDAIALLQSWAIDINPNIRRYASELTRPIGVWSRHIPALRKSPELAMPLLTPLLDDPSRYVQLSVGNWLNDASKDRPEWVQGVCAAEFIDVAATVRHRALRTIRRRSLGAEGGSFLAGSPVAPST